MVWTFKTKFGYMKGEYIVDREQQITAKSVIRSPHTLGA